MRTVAIALTLLASVAAPAWALTGTVIGPGDKPIEGARICYMLGGAEGLCALTDKRGFYELPASSIDRVQISADGFIPRTVGAVQQGTPIVLEPAGALWLRLVDDSGNPVTEGEIFLILPSGARKGPFPVNAKGVRIRTLPVDSYRVVARSPGYVQENAATAKVEAGKEREVDVVLEVAATER